MSCWVVPSLAAEIWRIPLEQIMQKIRDGDVASKFENGFTFVDVAPTSENIHARPPGPSPKTFVPISDEQIDALMREEPEIELLTQSGPEDESSADLGDWRAARLRTSRQRIAPSARLAAAN